MSFLHFFLKIIFYFQGRFAPAIEGSKINLGFLQNMAMKGCILPAFFLCVYPSWSLSHVSCPLQTVGEHSNALNAFPTQESDVLLSVVE